MGEKGAGAVLGLGLAGLAGLGVTMALIFAATRKAEGLPPIVPPEEEEVIEEIIDAEFRSGYVLWAALTDWRRVYTDWLNQWPADTDLTFSWTIRNTGNVGAYFQTYMITPGDWMYLGPGNELQIFEVFHTPAVPPIPGYNYYRINILARKITGERIGAVWTSDEVEVLYI